MRFDWDPAKAAKNVGRHRPTFEEATEVFAPGSVFMERAIMRNGELRWFRVGEIVRGVVVVVWTERVGDTVRIISARFANRVERALYSEYAKRTP
jgi:uncharacterized DUF497 family protein